MKTDLNRYLKCHNAAGFKYTQALNFEAEFKYEKNICLYMAARGFKFKARERYDMRRWYGDYVDGKLLKPEVYVDDLIQFLECFDDDSLRSFR